MLTIKVVQLDKEKNTVIANLKGVKDEPTNTDQPYGVRFLCCTTYGKEDFDLIQFMVKNRNIRSVKTKTTEIFWENDTVLRVQPVYNDSVYSYWAPDTVNNNLFEKEKKSTAYKKVKTYRVPDADYEDTTDNTKIIQASISKIIHSTIDSAADKNLDNKDLLTRQPGPEIGGLSALDSLRHTTLTTDTIKRLSDYVPDYSIFTPKADTIVVCCTAQEYQLNIQGSIVRYITDSAKKTFVHDLITNGFTRTLDNPRLFYRLNNKSDSSKVYFSSELTNIDSNYQKQPQ